VSAGAGSVAGAVSAVPAAGTAAGTRWPPPGAELDVVDLAADAQPEATSTNPPSSNPRWNRCRFMSMRA
jgi:hypothetical protein